MSQHKVPYCYGSTVIPARRIHTSEITLYLPARPAKEYHLCRPWFFPWTRKFFLEESLLTELGTYYGCCPRRPDVQNNTCVCRLLKRVGSILLLPFFAWCLLVSSLLAVTVDLVALLLGCPCCCPCRVVNIPDDDEEMIISSCACCFECRPSAFDESPKPAAAAFAGTTEIPWGDGNTSPVATAVVASPTTRQQHSP